MYVHRSIHERIDRHNQFAQKGIGHFGVLAEYGDADRVLEARNIPDRQNEYRERRRKEEGGNEKAIEREKRERERQTRTEKAERE